MRNRRRTSTETRVVHFRCVPVGLGNLQKQLGGRQGRSAVFRERFSRGAGLVRVGTRLLARTLRRRVSRHDVT